MRKVAALFVLIALTISCSAKATEVPTAAPAPTVVPTDTPVWMGQVVRFPFDTPPFWANQLDAWGEAAGIETAYEEVPFGQLHDRYQTAFISGDPDFTVLHSMDSWVAEWREKGWLLELDDLITDEMKEDLPAGSLDKLSADGHVYGIPLYFWIIDFYYNTEILENAGVDVPTTWTEVRETAKQIKDVTGEYGFCTSLGSTMANNLFGVILRTEGKEVFDGKPGFNNEEGVKSLQLIVDMLADESIHPSSFEYHATVPSIDLFIQGQCGMYMGPPPTLVQANNPDMSKVVGLAEVALMPGGSANKTATTHQTGSRSISAFANEGEKAASWKYIEHIMQTDQLIDMTLSLGRIPASNRALNDPVVQEQYPLARIIAEQLSSGPSGMMIIHEQASKLDDILGFHLADALINGVDAAKVLADAEAEMNDILNE